jgi:hypothetical protein
MKAEDLKKIMIRTLDENSDPEATSKKLEEAGVNYKFSEDFSSKVLDRIYSAGSSVIRKVEFARNLNFVFYRIALTGIAAIVILLISLFVMEGSLSFDSFLGLKDTYDESIVCILTGN